MPSSRHLNKGSKFITNNSILSYSIAHESQHNFQNQENPKPASVKFSKHIIETSNKFIHIAKEDHYNKVTEIFSIQALLNISACVCFNY